jgi:hypothetical protein
MALPKNPLKRQGERILNEANRLRGERRWADFELELLLTRFPRNRVFKKAASERGLTVN